MNRDLFEKFVKKVRSNMRGDIDCGPMPGKCVGLYRLKVCQECILGKEVMNGPGRN